MKAFVMILLIYIFLLDIMPMFRYVIYIYDHIVNLSFSCNSYLTFFLVIFRYVMKLDSVKAFMKSCNSQFLKNKH